MRDVLKPQALLLVALLAAVLALLFPSFSSLNDLWRDTENHTYTHGYLILGICCWLIWRAMPRVLAQKASPAYWLLLPLVIATAAWAVAFTAGVQDIYLLMLPVIAWLALATAFGVAVGRQLLLPIGFILFALPLWSSGNFILQQLTVWVNSFLVWAAGMSVYVHGNYVTLPAGLIEIADGCSGLHFFIVGVAIAVLYGELGDDTLRRRIEWIALAATLSMVSNWLRVFSITVAGYLTDMQHYLVRVDHYVFGWFVFAGMLIIFFWIANRRAATHIALRDPEPAPVEPIGRNAVAACCALLVAGLFPLLAWRATAAQAVQPMDVSWPALENATSTAGTDWRPIHPGASASGQRGYQLNSGASVALYQAIYAQQRQGAEMVGGGSSIFGPSEEWVVVAERTLRDDSGPWQEWEVRSARENVLIRARWQIGDRIFVRPFASQLWYGVARLFTPVTSRVTALRALCTQDCTAAQAALDEAGKLLSSQPVLIVSHTGIVR